MRNGCLFLTYSVTYSWNFKGSTVGSVPEFYWANPTHSTLSSLLAHPVWCDTGILSLCVSCSLNCSLLLNVPADIFVCRIPIRATVSSHLMPGFLATAAHQKGAERTWGECGEEKPIWAKLQRWHWVSNNGAGCERANEFWRLQARILHMFSITLQLIGIKMC